MVGGSSGGEVAMSVRLVAHQVDAVDVDGAPLAVDGDEQRQADRRLGGGHRQDEEHQDLAGALVELAGVGDQRQVGGVQHHLDREEDADAVAPGQRAGRADGEERHRQHQVPADRDAHALVDQVDAAHGRAPGAATRAAAPEPAPAPVPPGNDAGLAPPPARSASAAQLAAVESAASASSSGLVEPGSPGPPASSSGVARRATTVAPITATSSSRPTISNGSRYSANSSWARPESDTSSSVSGAWPPLPSPGNSSSQSAAANASAPRMAAISCARWPPGMPSWRPTLSSMMTNRKSTRMAPA